MKALKIIGMVIGGIGLFAGIAYLLALVLAALWNWLMPAIFGLPEISLLQAAGLFILSKLIFTPGSGGKGHRHKSSGNKEWKNRFMNKIKHSECYDQSVADTASH